VSDQGSTGDLVSAASVLAGVITFLYTHAYSRVSAALEIERGERQSADLKAERRKARHALWQALGAGAVALLLAGIFGPRVGDLVGDGHVFGEYDPIVLALVVVWLLFVGVAAHATWSAWRLARKHRELL
jgi:hypothetical protein